MGWEVLVPIILQYGIPFAEKMWGLFQAKAAPTQADWDALKVLAAQTRLTQMNDALIRNGIDPTSEKGQSLLALVQ